MATRFSDSVTIGCGWRHAWGMHSGVRWHALVVVGLPFACFPSTTTFTFLPRRLHPSHTPVLCRYASRLGGRLFLNNHHVATHADHSDGFFDFCRRACHYRWRDDINSYSVIPRTVTGRTRCCACDAGGGTGTPLPVYSTTPRRRQTGGFPAPIAQTRRNVGVGVM